MVIGFFFGRVPTGQAVATRFFCSASGRNKKELKQAAPSFTQNQT